MRLLAVGMVVLALMQPSGLAQEATGTVCVAPVSAERPTRWLVFYDPKTLTVPFDRDKPMAWPHEKSLR